MATRQAARAKSKPKTDRPVSDNDDRYMVPALARGLDILAALAGDSKSLTLTELAKVIGLTRSSTYRLVYTLTSRGYVTFESDTKSYRLGSGILNIGFGYLAARDPFEVAMPHLVRLRDRTGWSAHLGELQGREVVYLARVATRRSISSSVYVGTRLPARLTTMGRVLLSGLSRTRLADLYDETSLAAEMPRDRVADFLARCEKDRENGFVVQNASYEPGISSVAAPVFDAGNNIVAAINISVVSLFTTEAELNGGLKAEVVATAAAISRDLGHRPHASATRAFDRMARVANQEGD